MGADVGVSICSFQYCECYRISNCLLSQYTVGLRDFPHYEADNTPHKLRFRRQDYSLKESATGGLITGEHHTDSHSRKEEIK
jgi:hypothetical protein